MIIGGNFDSVRAEEMVDDVSSRIGISGKVSSYPDKQIFVRDSITLTDHSVHDCIVDLRTSIYKISDFVFLPIGGLYPNVSETPTKGFLVGLLPNVMVANNENEQHSSSNVVSANFVRITSSRDDVSNGFIHKAIPQLPYIQGHRLITIVDRTLGGVQRIMKVKNEA